MAAAVLNSERAVEVSLRVVRAFVRLRRVLAAHEELKAKLAEMERKCEAPFKVVFDALRQRLDADEGVGDRGPPIGFRHADAPGTEGSNRLDPVRNGARRVRVRRDAR